MGLREDYIAKIKRRLGDGVVNVELTDAQLGDSIDFALDHYNTLIGKVFWMPLTVVQGTSRYDLSGSDWDEVKNITAIQFIPNGEKTTLYSSFYESSGIPFSSFADQGLAFRNLRDQLQVTELLFDSIADFVFDRDNRILYLKVPTAASEVTLVCAGEATIGQVKYDLQSIFFDGCVAYAKEILGIVRRKYQGATLPGGEVNLDGAELSSEAKDEKELYEKKLLAHSSDIIIQG